MTSRAGNKRSFVSWCSPPPPSRLWFDTLSARLKRTRIKQEPPRHTFCLFVCWVGFHFWFNLNHNLKR
jgi:hypothetical protein